MASSITPAERRAMIVRAKAEGRKEAFDEAAQSLFAMAEEIYGDGEYYAGYEAGVRAAADKVQWMK